ncbi:notch domain-containing protein [Cryptosporidium muris RN66]|uniref:Notch domain-containing protein n=1 Tax=Cryptosporidium muris (strain RN66) TaxID=441375 RepID=B6ABC3_CRYMR|nr:notch domain-containing protein [Cryptosporidium muris RN66]EEA05675.1 notch domain-containing protein [Cryptosporidium muris RN66]|eukprot:XP_002140024.1 notch domain-containing protein [Cryptosporidium muris RN66]
MLNIYDAFLFILCIYTHFRSITSVETQVNVIPSSSNIRNVIPSNLMNKHSLSHDQNSQSNLDKIRLEFPKCPLKCEEGWLRDGWCDTECYVEECGFDGGDCKGWCAPECRPTWQGDGQCDLDCFNEKCEWDKGDCKHLESHGKSFNTTLEHKDFDYSMCKCNKTLLNNKHCDPECNTLECNMDGHDCLHRCNSRCINAWLGDGQCDPTCDTPECYFDKRDCKICSKNCKAWMVGNGICDIDCNKSECNYDNGDCSNVCSVTKVDYVNQPMIYKFCLKSWVGDGYCDEYCNNFECNFDNGDCNNHNSQLESNSNNTILNYLTYLNYTSTSTTLHSSIDMQFNTTNKPFSSINGTRVADNVLNISSSTSIVDKPINTLNMNSTFNLKNSSNISEILKIPNNFNNTMIILNNISTDTNVSNLSMIDSNIYSDFSHQSNSSRTYQSSADFVHFANTSNLNTSVPSKESHILKYIRSSEYKEVVPNINVGNHISSQPLLTYNTSYTSRRPTIYYERSTNGEFEQNNIGSDTHTSNIFGEFPRSYREDFGEKVNITSEASTPYLHTGLQMSDNTTKLTYMEIMQNKSLQVPKIFNIDNNSDFNPQYFNFEGYLKPNFYLSSIDNSTDHTSNLSYDSNASIEDLDNPAFSTISSSIPNLQWINNSNIISSPQPHINSDILSSKLCLDNPESEYYMKNSSLKQCSASYDSTSHINDQNSYNADSHVSHLELYKPKIYSESTYPEYANVILRQNSSTDNQTNADSKYRTKYRDYNNNTKLQASREQSIDIVNGTNNYLKEISSFNNYSEGIIDSRYNYIDPLSTNLELEIQSTGDTYNNSKYVSSYYMGVNNEHLEIDSPIFNLSSNILSNINSTKFRDSPNRTSIIKYFNHNNTDSTLKYPEVNNSIEVKHNQVKGHSNFYREQKIINNVTEPKEKNIYTNDRIQNTLHNASKFSYPLSPYPTNYNSSTLRGPHTSYNSHSHLSSSPYFSTTYMYQSASPTSTFNRKSGRSTRYQNNNNYNRLYRGGNR